MTALDDMADELAAHDVHVGFPLERADLARQLLHLAVSVPDVALLAAHCRETVTDGPAAAARVLVSLLLDSSKRDARLADLRVVADAKAKRAAEKGRAFGQASSTPTPIEGSDERAAWIASGLWDELAVRVPAAEERLMQVAETVGRTLAETSALIERGQAARAAVKPIPKAQADAPANTAEERIKEFRRNMHADAQARRMQKPRREFDWKRMEREQGAILAEIRERGALDLASVMRDPVKRGALVTLEADGHVVRAGEPDALQRQPYRVAANDRERAEFVAQRRLWEQADMDRPRQVHA